MTVSVKSQHKKWIEDPVLVAFSIHSKFSEGLRGLNQTEAMMTFIKRHAKNKVAILLCENSHINTFALNYNSIHAARSAMRKDAENLYARLASYFDGCEVVFEHDYIVLDRDYKEIKDRLSTLSLHNAEAKSVLFDACKKNYVPPIKQLYPNENAYIARAIIDQVEMGAMRYIACKHGYRHILYPGRDFGLGAYLEKYNLIGIPYMKQVRLYVVEK